MRIELSSPGDLEVTEFSFEAGKLTIKPQFFGNGLSANVFVCRVFDDSNKQINMSLIRISGKDATFMVTDRTQPVPPAMEVQRKIRRKESPATGSELGK